MASATSSASVARWRPASTLACTSETTCANVKKYKKIFFQLYMINSEFCISNHSAIKIFGEPSRMRLLYCTVLYCTDVRMVNEK